MQSPHYFIQPFPSPETFTVNCLFCDYILLVVGYQCPVVYSPLSSSDWCILSLEVSSWATHNLRLFHHPTTILSIIWIVLPTLYTVPPSYNNLVHNLNCFTNIVYCSTIKTFATSTSIIPTFHTIPPSKFVPTQQQCYPNFVLFNHPSLHQHNNIITHILFCSTIQARPNEGWPLCPQQGPLIPFSLHIMHKYSQQA